MPINPSLERKLSSMKDEMQKIRDKHKENQSSQNDQVAGQLELIKNKREQMLAAAKKSAEIASRQNEELDVTMLVANMLAEGDAKKPPVGQGGRDYEEHINNILKKHGKADKDATTAGSSADAPDAQFNHGGKKHNLEIKADSKAMFGQLELKHDGEKWDFSEKSKKKYPETHKALVKAKFLETINKKWKKPTGKYEDDLKMGNVYDTVDSAEPIKAHYGKDRKTDYIQIGKGHGFYHTGNDAAKLGSPELEGKTQLRARMKARGRDKDGNRTYGALVVMSLKDAPKSHHDLEKEVHKEWINYLLHGPQLLEATNAVAKPVEPGDSENHHIIHMTVSKDGKRQVRKATVTTHHGEAHAIKKAYKHYEDNGYEVHGHKVMKELEQIEVPKIKKESVELEEGLGRGREDDEYHVPDPVGRTHKIAFDVSKDGGEKHNRTVTISNSTKSHEEAKKAARAHLEKQGYKIHEASDICPVCGQTPCNCTTIEENAPVAPSIGVHRIQVTVSEPDHPAVSQRKETKQKFVRVNAHSKESAVERGKKHFAKKGFKVHDAEHVGMVHESVELDEASVPKNHTIEAHGIKGMKGTPWRKTFKSHDHLNDWAEKNDSVEVHGTRELEDVKKKTNESVISEGAYEDAEENKKSADDAKKQGDMFAHHLHMADHHDNMAQWHASKGRHGEADRHAEKAEQHHEEAMKHKDVKEEVAANSVGGGAIAGTQGDAGKKSVMTKPPMKRQDLKKFSFFVSQEHDK